MAWRRRNRKPDVHFELRRKAHPRYLGAGGGADAARTTRRPPVPTVCSPVMPPDPFSQPMAVWPAQVFRSFDFIENHNRKIQIHKSLLTFVLGE
jgi:hypothetical protein